MERQCRCRCRIKSVIVQLLWVGAQLPTLYNTVEYTGLGTSKAAITPQ